MRCTKCSGHNADFILIVYCGIVGWAQYKPRTGVERVRVMLCLWFQRVWELAILPDDTLRSPCECHYNNTVAYQDIMFVLIGQP